MTPKSSDVMKEEEVPTVMENADSSSLGKRKAEEDSEEDDEGEETESSVETSDDESEPETEPVFGYDSFEDGDYFSFSEDELIEAFDSDAESVKPFLDYRRQVHKTRGFDVDPESIPEDMIVGGKDVKMEYVVRALARKSAGIKCYITFMAKETPNGSLVEYQAKTEWKIRQVHTYPIFCRPSPPPVDLNAKKFCSLAEGSQETKVKSKVLLDDSNVFKSSARA